jgi:hypothetical protein
MWPERDPILCLKCAVHLHDEGILKAWRWLGGSVRRTETPPKEDLWRHTP